MTRKEILLTHRPDRIQADTRRRKKTEQVKKMTPLSTHYSPAQSERPFCRKKLHMLPRYRLQSGTDSSHCSDHHASPSFTSSHIIFLFLFFFVFVLLVELFSAVKSESESEGSVIKHIRLTATPSPPHVTNGAFQPNRKRNGKSKEPKMRPTLPAFTISRTCAGKYNQNIHH